MCQVLSIYVLQFNRGARARAFVCASFNTIKNASDLFFPPSSSCAAAAAAFSSIHFWTDDIFFFYYSQSQLATDRFSIFSSLHRLRSARTVYSIYLQQKYIHVYSDEATAERLTLSVALNGKSKSTERAPFVSNSPWPMRPCPVEDSRALIWFHLSFGHCTNILIRITLHLYTIMGGYGWVENGTLESALWNNFFLSRFSFFGIKFGAGIDEYIKKSAINFAHSTTIFRFQLFFGFWTFH